MTLYGWDVKGLYRFILKTAMQGCVVVFVYMGFIESYNRRSELFSSSALRLTVKNFQKHRASDLQSKFQFKPYLQV